MNRGVLFNDSISDYSIEEEDYSYTDEYEDEEPEESYSITCSEVGRSRN